MARPGRGGSLFALVLSREMVSERGIACITSRNNEDVAGVAPSQPDDVVPVFGKRGHVSQIVRTADSRWVL